MCTLRAYVLLLIRKQLWVWNNDVYQQRPGTCYLTVSCTRLHYIKDTSMASNASSPCAQLQTQIPVLPSLPKRTNARFSLTTSCSCRMTQSTPILILYFRLRYTALPHFYRPTTIRHGFHRRATWLFLGIFRCDSALGTWSSPAHRNYNGWALGDECIRKIDR
jgi:hypothetical protein